MAKRALSEQIGERDAMSSPRAVRDFLLLTLGDRQNEVFLALFLDAQNGLLASEELFRGTLTQKSIYPPEVVKAALRYNAAAVIFTTIRPESPSRVADANAERRAFTGGDQDARPLRRRRKPNGVVRRARASLAHSLTLALAKLPAPRYCSTFVAK